MRRRSTSARGRTNSIISTPPSMPRPRWRSNMSFPGSALDRTEKVVRRGIDIILGKKGVEHVASFAGFDATTFTVASNAATIFSGLPSLYNHELRGVTANTVIADLRK